MCCLSSESRFGITNLARSERDSWNHHASSLNAKVPDQMVSGWSISVSFQYQSWISADQWRYMSSTHLLRWSYQKPKPDKDNRNAVLLMRPEFLSSECHRYLTHLFLKLWITSWARTWTKVFTKITLQNVYNSSHLLIQSLGKHSMFSAHLS